MSSAYLVLETVIIRFLLNLNIFAHVFILFGSHVDWSKGWHVCLSCTTYVCYQMSVRLKARRLRNYSLGNYLQQGEMFFSMIK